MSLLALALCLQQATLHANPAQAQVGQPVTWTLVVDHDVDESVELESLAGLADDSWVLLSGPDVARTRDGERASTRIQWSYFSLEAGDRALPSVEVSLTSGLSVEALAGHLEVIGDLGPDEDAPRPVGGPLVPPEASEVSGPSAWYLLPIPLILFIVLLRRMGRKRVPVPVSLPPVDLAELLATAPAHGDFAAALSLRIREAFDVEQGAAVRSPNDPIRIRYAIVDLVNLLVGIQTIERRIPLLLHEGNRSGEKAAVRRALPVVHPVFGLVWLRIPQRG